MKQLGGLLLIGSLILALGACSTTKPQVELPDLPDLPTFGNKKKAEATIDFNSDVRPLLEKNCVACHNSSVAKRGLNLENAQVASKSWRGGKVVVPGKPEQSMLYQVSMLAGGEGSPHTLNYAQRDILYRWIEEGAYWPAGPAGQLNVPSSGGE